MVSLNAACYGSGAHLRLEFLNFMPYIRQTNGTVIGMFTLFWKELAKSLNFTYSFHRSRHVTWGDPAPNGSWDGHLGSLQRNYADVALGPMVVEEKRRQGFDFLEFHSVTWAGILASVGQAGAGSFVNFLFTFEKLIWVLLLTSFFSLVFVSALNDSMYEKDRKFVKSLTAYFWVFLASLFLEGSPRTPRKGLAKILLGIWLLSVLVLMNGFCSQFKALLMMRGEEDIIRDLEDLAEKPHIIFLCAKNTMYEKAFLESDFEAYKKIYRNSLKKDGFINSLEFSRPGLYQRVKSGGVAAVTAKTILESHLALYCDQLKGNRRMYFVNDAYYISYLSWAVKKNFPRCFYKKLNQRIVWLRESGLVEKWVSFYIGRVERCVQASDSSGEGSLSLSQLLPIFVIFYVAQGACFLYLLIERYKSKKATTRKKN